MLYTSVKVFLWLRPRIVLVKDTLLKLCNIDNTNPWDLASLFNSREFPAHMEYDANESLLRDDKQQQQQQQQQGNDDDDVEMIHPVEWNNADDNYNSIT